MTERSKFPVAVNVIFAEKDGIWLFLRQNTGYRDDHWAVLGGHLETTESVAECAVREVQEETGIQISKSDLQFVHALSSNDFGRPYLNFFFVVENWEGTLSNLEPEKCAELRWFPLSELPEVIAPNSQKGIDGWRNGVLYSELDWE